MFSILFFIKYAIGRQYMCIIDYDNEYCKKKI